MKSFKPYCPKGVVINDTLIGGVMFRSDAVNPVNTTEFMREMQTLDEIDRYESARVVNDYLAEQMGK